MSRRSTTFWFLSAAGPAPCPPFPGHLDPNRDATRQEMRAFVCGQCHVEDYFKGDGKVVTYPWANGLKVEEIEAYDDKEGFTDWVHAETGTKMLTGNFSLGGDALEGRRA